MTQNINPYIILNILPKVNTLYTENNIIFLPQSLYKISFIHLNNIYFNFNHIFPSIIIIIIIHIIILFLITYFFNSLIKNFK